MKIEKPSDAIRALRSGDKFLQSQAVQRIRLAVEREVKRRHGHHSAQDIDDALQEYILRVLPSESNVAACSIESWRGLARDIQRRHKKARGSSIEERPSHYFEHISRKVTEMLAEGAAFAAWTVDARRFILADSPVGPICTLSCDEVAERLPALPSSMRQKSDDKLARLVEAEPLQEQIVRVFEHTQNAPWFRWAMAEVVFSTLSPGAPKYAAHEAPNDEDGAPPSDPYRAAGATGVDEVDAEDLAVRRGWEAQSFIVARDLVAGLSEQTRLAAALRWAGDERTLEEAAEHMDIGPQAVAYHCGKNGLFQLALRAAAMRYRLDQDEREALLNSVLEILRDVSFSEEEGFQ